MRKIYSWSGGSLDKGDVPTVTEIFPDELLSEFFFWGGGATKVAQRFATEFTPFITEFTVPGAGTWVSPVTGLIRVECVGSGGNGAASSGGSGGGGGGGGGYAAATISVVKGQVYNHQIAEGPSEADSQFYSGLDKVIGYGGYDPDNGGYGGSGHVTWPGATDIVTHTGGDGGAGNASFGGGGGGAAASETDGNPAESDTEIGGDGGAPDGGRGGNGGVLIGGVNNRPGDQGSNYGGGGGGGVWDGSPHAGGTGGAALIRITFPVSVAP